MMTWFLRTQFVVVTLMVVWWSVAKAENFTLTILHTNDVHAQYDQFNKYGSPCSEKEANESACFGGFARLKTALDQMKSQYPNHVVLDAGDQYQGTMWFYKYGGNVTSHFMNWLGYDAMTLGNHEFDRGWEALVGPLLSAVDFPVVSSNIDASRVPGFMDHINKSIVLTVNGQKIGIVAYTTQETPHISSPGDIEFNDVVNSLTPQVEQLTRAGVNKIIALGHAGYTMDKEQVAKIPGVDVVVGGHSHTFLYTPVNGPFPSNEASEGDYPTVVDQQGGLQALVVQAYTKAKYLGVIHVTFNDEGHVIHHRGSPMLLDANVTQDPSTLAELAPWKKGVEAEERVVVGRTMVHLEGDRTVCRRAECNMGNVLTDAMIYNSLKYPSEGSWNNVGIAIMNGGGVRNSIGVGNITIADVLGVQPFQNTVDAITIKGQHLRAALEHSVAGYDPCNRANLGGAFLQVSGLQVRYDMRKPAGQRVVSALALCTRCLMPEYRPLNDSDVYKVILPSFTADGGDFYTMIRDNIIERDELGELDSDVTIAYLKKFSPITKAVEGRVAYVDNTGECEGVRKGYASACVSNSASLMAGLMGSLRACIVSLIMFCMFT